MGPFGLGQPVLRSEDTRFLTGAGCYTADITFPNEAHAVVLRSPHAHAEIRGIHSGDARAAAGVLLVITSDDLAPDGLGDIPCDVRVRGESGEPKPTPGRPLLARARVRFVGEPVLMIVAETAEAARDALDLVDVEYHPLASLASLEDACTHGQAVSIWDEAADGIAFFWQRGNAAAVDQALARATHQVMLQLVHNRVIPCPMEPRACIGQFDVASDRYTLHTGSQGAHAIRDQLVKHTLKVPEDRIRVVVPDVGGGFGSKMFHYPEEALVLWAARRIGRPVKWVADRSETFCGDTHGRDQRNTITAGFDADGRILALRVATQANMGAYLNQYGPSIPSQMTGCMLSGCYAIPAIHATCHGYYTNTVPVDAYRGAGRPEATYIIERLMDEAARTLELGQDEIRRRNFIRPSQMPYKTQTGPTYDCGDFARNLDDALTASAWRSFDERRAEARSRGKLRGIGLSAYIEICGYGEEEATLRCHADGHVELLIGTQSNGQGHATAYAQIVAERLGIDFAQVTVVQGDTDRIPFGEGTGGSRSLPVGGPAVVRACSALIERGEMLARHLLQAGDRSVGFRDGRFRLGENESSITLAGIATALAENDAKDDAGGETFSASARYSIEASTFPNGVHVCEVEIDEETGLARVVAYHVVDDFGVVVNPHLLKGQIRGGVAQGLGQALFEHALYDPATAQLLSGSFTEYGIPRATDVPAIEPRYNNVPCTTNPLGIKGAGEAGTIAACPAVVNAVQDALAPLGVRHVDMPLTAETLWRAIDAARG